MRGPLFLRRPCLPIVSVLLAAVLAAAQLVAAAPQFPALTGRVVDEAVLLCPGARAALTRQLEGHEQATGEQVVVVTLNSLQGYAIEDYGYQLGRHWGIGEKDKNTGVLLIVAPNERRMRIEVGYGLEDVLTDALSHRIIRDVIRPYLKKGDYEQGILQGAGAILKVLGGEYQPSSQKARESQNGGPVTFILVFLVIALINVVFGAYRRDRRGVYWGGGLGGYGGGMGGGFGGGGGLFGGGGSSGSW